MSKIYKSLIILIFVCFYCFYNLSYSKENNKKQDKQTNKTFNVSSNNKLEKPIEEITIDDIILDEPISQDLQDRINELISESQNELDRYRSIMDYNYKQVESRMLEVKKDVNKIYNFKDDIEANLNIAKWMIISLSSGILCLTAIILVMWRSVTNVNRKDVEVMFSIEKTKRDIKNLEEKVNLIEMLYKKNENK